MREFYHPRQNRIPDHDEAFETLEKARPDSRTVPVIEAIPYARVHQTRLSSAHIRQAIEHQAKASP